MSEKMTNPGCCNVCGLYCEPKEQIIVRPCYHIFHMVCYSAVIGYGESVTFCPVPGCHIGRPPFCGGCYNPIHFDEVNAVTLPCGHRFHEICYAGKLAASDKELGACPLSRCIPCASNLATEKRTLAESDGDDDGNQPGCSSGVKRSRGVTGNTFA